MSEFKLNIDEKQIKDLVAEGLLAQLTEELRADILKQAVAYLLTPPTGDRYNVYGSRETPLQAAFNQAANAAVRDIVTEMTLEDGEFQQKIRNAVGETVLAATRDEWDLQEAVAQGVGQALMQAWRSKQRDS